MSSTPKLPLTSAYRLRVVTAPKAKDQEQRRQRSQNWNGNGQGATNDSEEYKAAVRIIDGFPVEYSCLDDPRENDLADMEVNKLTMKFDYEMISRKSTDVDKSMHSLEWSLLWNVARNLGLHNCNYKKQDPQFDTRRELAGAFNSSESYVVGLSSLDFDRVDYETKYCTFLNNAADERTICTPMLGAMTAYFTGEEEKIRHYLELNVAKEMNSRRVRIEEVKECHYIGDRKLFRSNASSRETLDSKNNSSTNLALVFGVLAGVIMLSFAILLARGRRRREAIVLEDVDDNTIDPNPIPVPPMIFDKVNQEQGLPDMQLSNAGGSEDSISDRVDVQEDLDAEKGLPPVSVSTIFSGDAPISADSYQLPPRADERTDATANSEKTDNKENLELPHLPPVCVIPVDDSTAKEPIESKTLRKRRKRKKKKKKQKALKRISSKHSINEMETINEMDEGDDDIEDEGSEIDGSEYSASEYSTDDEDDMLRMVQTPTDSSDNANSPKVSPGPVVPPSPIREEPKIRRLPPPWV